MANGDACFSRVKNMCLSASVYWEEGIFQPCSSSLSKPIKGVQMKMEDVLPRARRVQHQGQVASSICTVGLNTSGTHMARAAYSIDFV